MNIPNLYPPERMTAEQRRAEVASYLALGLVRLRCGQNIATPTESVLGLGFGRQQRVHDSPVNQTTRESA